MISPMVGRSARTACCSEPFHRRLQFNSGRVQQALTIVNPGGAFASFRLSTRGGARLVCLGPYRSIRNPIASPARVVVAMAVGFRSLRRRRLVSLRPRPSHLGILRGYLAGAQASGREHATPLDTGVLDGYALRAVSRLAHARARWARRLTSRLLNPGPTGLGRVLTLREILLAAVVDGTDVCPDLPARYIPGYTE